MAALDSTPPPERPAISPDLLRALAEIGPDLARGLTVDQYMELSERGAFDGERVELLAGVVVTMTAQGPQHLHVMTLMNRLLARRLTDDFMVVPQCTYQLSEISAPEPDFAIVTARSVWNPPQRAAWLIEVAYSSLAKDRGIKALLYAAGGIEEYWVIDATTNHVHVHRDPSPDRYRSIEQHDEHTRLAPRAIPSLAFSIHELLTDKIQL